MLINNLNNFQEFFDAFYDVADDICKLYDAVKISLDEETNLRNEGKSTLSNEQFERLEELQNTLNNLTAYV
ncbi:MAG: hypothetical protein IJR43_04650 [Synergistaceae bacterium]|nr:hypothetical protein [Synergistaceae bacterium]MBQ3695058.1 hypothetical protein [Synergistaceae bacterium]MBQ9628531.1 hypothetical protein [Synergistaceae bacterium]MBR0250661.1 hypothetical protein [Synergistaceae bacterium]